MTAAARGPFVRGALLCERVLCETDGALSAIRILHEGRAVASPVPVTLMLMLVRGEVSAGSHRAVLQIRGPEGQILSAKPIEFRIDDGGPEQSSSVILDISFEPRAPGVYWFQVLWGEDGRLVTQVPFTAHAAARAGAPSDAQG